MQMIRISICYICLLVCILPGSQAFIRRLAGLARHQRQVAVATNANLVTSKSLTFTTPAFTRTRLMYKNFDEFLETADGPILIDFYATWCGPCKLLQPVLEEVANRFENVCKVAKVDTDKAPKLGLKYRVEALPTLILFYKGQPVERFEGYRSADVLEQELRTVS